MAKTKTCGDCVYADVCEHLPNLPLFHRKNEALCVTFKDKADFVEVVRCKDCKHNIKPIGKIECRCELDGKIWDNNDFCSYGERREGE